MPIGDIFLRLLMGALVCLALYQIRIGLNLTDGGGSRFGDVNRSDSHLLRPTPPTKGILLKSAKAIGATTASSLNIQRRNDYSELTAPVEEPSPNASSTMLRYSNSTTAIVVAYAISVSSCHEKNDNVTPSVVDGAAVLGYSIRNASIRSRYSYRLYAFVHHDAQNCNRELAKLGWQVMIKDVPFEMSDIQDEGLQQAIPLQGCCGEREFLKLYAYTLVGHEIVVHLDVDTLVLQPLDELYDYMLGLKRHKIKTIPSDLVIPEVVDFFFTREYNTPPSITTDRTKFGVQGAFFISKPNITLFDEMVALLKVSKFKYTLGWDHRLYGGYYGSAQVQGFLSYVYGEIYPDRAVELNPCHYNTLATPTTTFEGSVICQNNKSVCSWCRTNESVCEDCSLTPFNDIRMAHLSKCHKPWKCPRTFHKPLCKNVLRQWYSMRHAMESQMNIRMPAVGSGYMYDSKFGYCRSKEGPRQFRMDYVPLDVWNVTVD
jgi:hypothetical protein